LKFVQILIFVQILKSVRMLEFIHILKSVHISKFVQFQNQFKNLICLNCEKISKSNQIYLKNKEQTEKDGKNYLSFQLGRGPIDLRGARTGVWQGATAARVGA
jgi:hypothetical protein